MVTVVLILAQVFPLTGIFLMMLGGPLWTGLAILCTLGAFTIDALRGAIPRLCLIIPLGFFGGYYAAYFSQGADITAREAELQRSNPTKVFAYDPDRHSLVTKHAGGIVSSFKVPVAYAKNKNYDEGYLATRLAKRATCKSVPRDSLARINTSWFHRKNLKGKRRLVREICKLRYPEKPDRTLVEVNVDDGKWWRSGTTIAERTHTLVVDGETLGVYRRATVERYAAFPFPFYGCFLNSGAARWDCSGGFWTTRYQLKSRPASLPEDARTNPVAIMLGLEPYTSADYANFVEYPSNAASIARVMGEADRVTANAYDQLQQLIDDPKMKLPWRMGYSLASDTKRLAAHADSLVFAFAKFASEARGKNYRALNRARAIATAVAALPEDKFTEHGTTIFDAVRADTWWKHRPALYIRTADAGPETFAMYKAHFTNAVSRGWLKFAPVLALCRLDTIDQETLDLMKLQFANVDTSKDKILHQALFLALLRHGARTDVERHLSDAKPRHRKWYQAVLDSHGTASLQMPNNCAVRSWGGKSYFATSMKGTVPR